MADNKELLILRLEGLLQSWGECSKWDFRDSGAMPTKSGIVGLIGCAMGAERGSQALSELSQAISVAVRGDRPGVKYIDYQTVTGDPLMAASGGPRVGSNTFISPRAYLQDASFTVFIEADEYWIGTIITALAYPKWSMFLGRKCCVPSRPVFQEVTDQFESIMDAVQHYPAAPRARFPMSFECEIPQPNAVSVVRPDDLIGSDRKFASRRVWRGIVERETEDVSE